MDPKDLERIAKLLPEYPRNLSPIEWVAVVFVAVVLLVYMATELFIKPRAAKNRAAEERADREASAKERAGERTEFLAALHQERRAREDGMQRVGLAIDVGTQRLHDRLDDVIQQGNATRRDIAKLSCYEGGRTEEVPPARPRPAIAPPAEPRTG